jgi:uncharacterized OB-fold protein
MDMNIYGYKCKRCGHVQYPYRTVCQHCHDNDHNEFDIVPLAKKGKLVTFTHLYNPPADFEMVFLTLGIVELEDGHCITGQLKIDKPKIGMKVTGNVELVRHDEYNKSYGMVFYAA